MMPMALATEDTLSEAIGLRLLAELPVPVTPNLLLRKDGFQVLDAFGIQEGRAVRGWPNLMASVAVFKFQRG